MSTHEHLRADLDHIARRAATQLERASARDAARRSLGTALALMLAVPAAAIAVLLVRLLAGAADARLWWWIVPLTLVPGAILLAWRLVAGRRAVTRGPALGAVDRRLGAADRLRTADEFLGARAPDAFMLAAIADAEAFTRHARDARVIPSPSPMRARRLQIAAALLALALLPLALWLSTIARASGGIEMVSAGMPAVAGAAEAAPIAYLPGPPEPAVTPPPPEAPPREARRDPARTKATAPASKTIPEGAEPAEGSLGVGQTSESDQTSNPSTARGAPSSQGQPSKPGPPRQKKPRPTRRKPARPQEEAKPPAETKDPAGSTAGQGTARGSNKNPAVSDWSSRDQVNTPDDDQLDEEPDVEDEEEEQESRGGLQPNLRDRRPPVNRDLRIGFGSGKNPDANGRGGPSQQKKSRGVASFVLGVPIPDRVKGQPNPGRTKVTQQRIEPEAEQADPAVAAAPLPRAGPTDPVYHPELTPWLRDLIRSYFLQQRQTAPEG